MSRPIKFVDGKLHRGSYSWDPPNAGKEYKVFRELTNGGDEFIGNYFKGQAEGALKWILFMADIYLLSDLQMLTDEELLSIDGLGKKRLDSIRKIAPYKGEQPTHHKVKS